MNYDTGDPVNLKIADRGRASEASDVRIRRPWLSLGSILSPSAVAATDTSSTIQSTSRDELIALGETTHEETSASRIRSCRSLVGSRPGE